MCEELFWVVPRSDSGLKMETTRFSETLVSIYKFTLRHNPEEHRHHYHCGNLKFHMYEDAFNGSVKVCETFLYSDFKPNLNCSSFPCMIHAATFSLPLIASQQYLANNTNCEAYIITECFVSFYVAIHILFKSILKGSDDGVMLFE
jgi:hypothetical protein